MVLKLWVECRPGDWIDADCGGFQTVWRRFDVFEFYNNTLSIYFTGHPSSGWTENTS